MKRKVLGAILGVALSLPLFGGYKNTEELYVNEFNTRDSLTEWSLGLAPKAGTKGNDAVLSHWHGENGKSGFLRFSASGQKSDLISIELPAEKMKGLIQLEARIRGKKLAVGSKAYFGPKVMLFHQFGKKNSWPEPEGSKLGTYDWRTVAMILEIPQNTTKVILTLGIQSASGEFDVDYVRIYRCEESDESVTVSVPENREALAIPRGPGKGTRYRGVMSGHDLSAAAFETLADWNVNLIRYQMQPGNRNISTPELYLSWIDDEMKKVDSIMPLLKKHGMKVVIDLHTGPNTKVSKVASNILTESTNFSTLIETWKRLAAHFKGNPLIYGYDLLNEPVATEATLASWQKVVETLVEAIRKIDPVTPIIIEPCAAIDNFDGGLKPIRAENIIYSPHFYQPFSYSHQGVHNKWLKWSYPGYIAGTYWDKEQLRVAMKSTIDFQRKYNVPIFVGEFSVICWAKGGEKYLSDLIELMEEYGWDWTYHAFREWGGWSVEHSAEKPFEFKRSASNPRKDVLLKALKENRRFE